jgi:hypothetical protein
MMRTIFHINRPKSNHARLVHANCGGPTMAKSFDEPKRPNVVWTDLEGDEGVLCGMVVREIMWRYFHILKR